MIRDIGPRHRNAPSTLSPASPDTSAATAGRPTRGTGPWGTAAPPPEEGCGEFSGDVPHDRRTDELCNRNRQAFPDLDREPELRVLWTDLWKSTAVAQPVVPVKRKWLCAPLLLEVEGSTARRRTPEVEHSVPRPAPEFQRGVVEEHVRRKLLVSSIRRRPRDLQDFPEPVQASRR